jgi:hypothetical protein
MDAGLEHLLGGDHWGPNDSPVLTVRKHLKNGVEPGGKTNVFSPPRLVADRSAAERKIASRLIKNISRSNDTPGKGS